MLKIGFETDGDDRDTREVILSFQVYRDKIFAIECREQITRSSYVDEKELSKITGIRTTIDEQIRAIG